MALTIDGDLHLGTYRRDLFEDPATRQAFQAGYGRPLEPPRTWQEYRDIAAFFGGRPAPDGTPLAGTALAGTLEAYARGGQRIWYLFSHAATYANHPDRPGAMFFDPDTMVPAIDNPAWVRALQEFLDLRRFGPTDAHGIDSEAVRRRFADGEGAMNIDWADTGVLAGDPRRSRVAGKIGFFPLPGSQEVWNPASREWDRLAEPRSVTFLAFGGWIGVVPAASPHPDKAWSYLAWYWEPRAQRRGRSRRQDGHQPVPALSVGRPGALAATARGHRGRRLSGRAAGKPVGPHPGAGPAPARIPGLCRRPRRPARPRHGRRGLPGGRPARGCAILGGAHRSARPQRPASPLPPGHRLWP